MFLRKVDRDFVVGLRKFLAGVPGDDSEHQSLKALNTYLRNKHKVSVCDICVRHGTQFVGELPRLTASQMRAHREKGDPAAGE